MPTVIDQALATVALSGVTSINCDYPATISDASQTLFAVFVCELGLTAPSALNTPAGWTQISQQVDPVFPTCLSALYWKQGDGSTGSVTFTYTGGSGNAAMSVGIVLIADTRSALPFDGPSTSTATNSATFSATGTTTTVANDLVLSIFTMNASEGVPFHSVTAGETVISAGSVDESIPALLIATTVKTTAGATGSKTANISPYGGRGARMYVIGFKPYDGPSVPVLTFPNGGENLTAGATVNPTWNPSTSPTATQASLKYNLDFSSNNGSSWSNLITLTAAGLTSTPWVVPSTPLGSGWLIRVRSNDPALSLYSSLYDQSNAPFSVVAETAPGQPIITSPASGSVVNKGVLTPVTWIHQGGAGNPQTEATVLWSRDGFASHTSSPIVISSGTQSTSINFSGETVGATISVKVKTKGLSLYSAYSNVTAFVVASLPATPNITAPTAGSPPTQPIPTATFTEADAFVARWVRIMQGAIEAYPLTRFASSALSFPFPYSVANGVAFTFYLSVENSYGLRSAEDSETFTAAYSGPAVPVIAVTPVDGSGYNLIQIANSDTPSYTELWRYAKGSLRTTAIRISPPLPRNASFADSNIKSGQYYQYYARAYSGAGLFTDSADSLFYRVILRGAFLHLVTRTSTSGNALSPTVAIEMQEGSEFTPQESAGKHYLLGRSKPVGVRGQAAWKVAHIVGESNQSNVLINLMTIWRARSVVCIRDYAGHLIFGKMIDLPQSKSVEILDIDDFDFTVIEESYVEGI
jgi:hypothetical protein